MKILALDLGTTTGWATNHPESSGTENFQHKREESPGMRFLRFKVWLEEVLSMVEPDLVVFEQAHHRGGAATAVAAGLVAHTLTLCAERSLEHSSFHSATIKKHAVGKGSGYTPTREAIADLQSRKRLTKTKASMMIAYQLKWGIAPADDNECDARWLLDLAKKEYGA